MNIKPCIIGLGYVGLPLACLAADKGFKITGYDKNNQIIKSLKLGISHIDDDDVNKFLALKSKTEDKFYNVGTGKKTSIKNLCKLIVKLKEKNTKIVDRP